MAERNEVLLVGGLHLSIRVLPLRDLISDYTHVSRRIYTSSSLLMLIKPP